MATVPAPATGTQSVTQQQNSRVFALERSADNGITAAAGGGQANATQLQYAMTRVTTVATIGDSVKLPKAKAGMERIVKNAAANSMNVFPASGDAINALAADAAYAVAGTKVVTFYCMVDGTWDTDLTA